MGSPVPIRRGFSLPNRSLQLLVQTAPWACAAPCRWARRFLLGRILARSLTNRIAHLGLALLLHALLESALFDLRLPRAQSPFHGISQLPECLPILHRQLYNECTLIPSPYIASDAASQPITMVIYLYEGRTAAVAATGHHLSPHVNQRLPHLIESQRCPPRDSMTGHC